MFRCEGRSRGRGFRVGSELSELSGVKDCSRGCSDNTPRLLYTFAEAIVRVRSGLYMS